MSERRFRHTPGGVCSLWPHLVWCAKYRRREVIADHVHLFVRIGPTNPPAQVVRAFKGRTTQVPQQEYAYLRQFATVSWSPSNFAAPVGHVSASTVRRDIEYQRDKVAS